jgi:hydroxyacylglutathione hydrolase
MSARPMSTLGFERIANPFLRAGLTREAFVERLLGKLPPFPPYYRRMKVLNSQGPATLDGLPGGRAIPADEFHTLVEQGHVVIDVRDQIAFGAAHIPGAFGLGLGTFLSTWAAWVVPYDRALLLVGAQPADTAEAVRSLVRVGLDSIDGYLAGGLDAWIAAGYPVRRLRQASPAELLDDVSREPSIRVLDVRSDDEWEAGHVCGATHLMGGYLPDHARELARGGGPLAVVCQTGYRSTVAASVLERAGAADVRNVTGGMTAWQQAGLPVCTD